MTNLFKSTALALAASSVALTAVPAQAQGRYDRHDRYEQRYDRYDRSDRYDRDDRRYQRYDSRYGEPLHRNTRTWRGRDGNYYCRKSDGTTGLIIGAAAGALLGRTIDTRGDRTLGTLLGGAAGALLGKQVDSGSRCR